MNTRSYYQILGIDQTATSEDVKKAYRKTALKWHPDHYKGDKDVATKKMQEVNEANEVLSDDKKRREYDNSLGSYTKPVYSQPHTTFNSNNNSEENLNIHLPKAAIFTGKPPKDMKLNVILLGSTNAGKSLFVANLFDKIPLYTSTIGIEFKVFQPHDLKFCIYDLAGQERFKMITSSYFRMASIILIFDELESHLDQCKKNLSSTIEHCQVLPISYLQASCQFGAIEKLEQFQFNDNDEMSCDPYRAHMFSKQMFYEFEQRLLLAKLQHSNDNQILTLEGPVRDTRPGCC